MPRSTITAIMLGKRLRAIREDLELSQDQVADLCDWPKSKLSKVENGRQKISRFDIYGLCGVYGTSDAVKNELQRMAAAASEPGWWEPYSSLMLTNFSMLIEFEQFCTEMLIYEAELITGLLQTEQYAAAVQEPDADEKTVRKSVALRTRRQEGFWARKPLPKVTVVLWESAIRSQACDQEQLNLLKRRNRSTGLDIRVLSLAVGPYPGPRGPFSVLTFDDPHGPADVVYSESVMGARYDERQVALEEHHRVFEKTFKHTAPLKEFL